MTPKRPSGRQGPAKKPSQPAPRETSPTAVSIRRAAGDEWQLVLPRCAQQRAEDMEEVDAMIAAGEPEIAADELRFLLQECPDFLVAHQTLGQIALEAEDFALARGHFGYVFDLARKVWERAGARGTLPYRMIENQSVHESGKGLGWSLHHLQNDTLALEVVRQLLAWEPTDPLGVRPWLGLWGKSC
ncbi:MAG: hypothetical protein JSS27_08160 [Planctomycetes bacterium]|nr:hypothetical protein [Planctomycetota bacterium]